MVISVGTWLKGESDRIISQILQLANYLEKDTDRAIVLAALAKKYAENLQYDRALQIANTISDKGSKARTLAEVILLCAKIIQVDEFANTLSRSIQNAQEIEYEDEVKWRNIRFIADCCFEAGRYDRALQVARIVPNGKCQIKILTDIAVAYAKAGEEARSAETFARAFEQVNTLEDKYLLSYWWIWIAAKYTETGQGNKMPEILVRSEHLLNALKSLELDSLEA